MAKKKKSKKGATPKGVSHKRAKGTKRVPKKHSIKKRAAKKKVTSKRGTSAGQRSGQNANRIYTHKEGVRLEPEKAGLRSGGQSGDLQSLPDREGPDSESVDELLEEGNAFEADAIAGVQHAEDNEEREVHTHEVPEDDVPEEYLDKDS